VPDRLLLAGLEAVPNGVVLTDRDGTILWVNPAFTRMTGYALSEALGQNPRLLKSGVHERSFFERLWATILAGDVWTGEIVNRRKDGSTYFEEQTITPVRSLDGALSHFIAIKQDITARKRSEEALRDSEALYRLLADNVTDVISVFDMNLRQTYVSPSILALTGYSAAETTRRSMEERLSPASWEVVRTALAEELAGERSGLLDPARARTLEIELRRKDGSTVWTETRVSFLRDPHGTPRGYIAVSRDVSGRKRLERDREQVDEQLRQAQKMEAVGRLAGGIAHDFNNLLTVVIGRSQILASRLGSEDPRRRDIEMIEGAAQRGASLTRQLLTFSRRQMVEPRAVDVNGVVRGVESLLRRVIGEDIELATALAQDLALVRADSSQLEQILMNLAVNSRDAMPDGGLLTIETANVALDARYAEVHLDVRPGPYVMLAIRDTGHGMDGATKARIFEPFFTTKEPGKGTGLGLATVHGIVTQSEGHIEVSSAVGQGTTFRIYFPRLAGPAAGGPAPLPALVAGGSETILLVEDDEQVRSLARQVLEQKGYRIVDARTPGEALARAGGAERIDLLVTDVIMPEMTGPVLARRLRESHPETRVLYVSGYAADAIGRPRAGDPRLALLQKPFTVNTLAAKVREVLDTRPGDSGQTGPSGGAVAR
jgi:PAS domain S-box-containing protein